MNTAKPVMMITGQVIIESRLNCHDNRGTFGKLWHIYDNHSSDTVKHSSQPLTQQLYRGRSERGSAPPNLLSRESFGATVSPAHQRCSASPFEVCVPTIVRCLSVLPTATVRGYRYSPSHTFLGDGSWHLYCLSAGQAQINNAVPAWDCC